MGVYGLAWTPAFIFETIWTPGPNFGSKAPLAPNLKIATFSQNLIIWVSIDLPLAPNFKIAIFPLNLAISVSMDLPGSLQPL